MNELKLSKRLEKVASYVPKDAIVADIGSDHAYLPCYLILQGKVNKVIAGEVAEGPYRSAKEQVQKLNLLTNIDVRKGDGLEVVSPGEVNCFTIAGMGGSLIRNILNAGKDKLSYNTRLVLQPNIGAELIRNWLYAEGWQLIAEEIIEEDSKIYEILIAEKGNPELPYQNMSLKAGLLLGPFLLCEKNPVFKQKWESELIHWKKIKEQLIKIDTSERNKIRVNELEEKISLVEGVLS